MEGRDERARETGEVNKKRERETGTDKDRMGGVN